MPLIVQCPECGSELEVDEEHRDWTVRCPHCRHEFRPSQAMKPGAPAVPAVPAVPDEPVEDRPPRRRRRRRDDEDDDDFEDDIEWARHEVAGPAAAVQAIGWLGLVLSTIAFGIWVVVLAMVMNQPAGNNNANQQDRDGVIGQAAVYIPQSCIMFGISLVMVIGARKMARLESHSWAMTGAIVGMLPCVSPCCLLGLPFGIWALSVLNRPSVERAFRRNRRPADLDDD